MVSTAQRLADEIMKTVRKLSLPFECDTVTDADGNCFPKAIMQQLKRPEFFHTLQPIWQRIVEHKDHLKFREQVARFILNSNHPRVAEFKRDFKVGYGPEQKKTWMQY